jgi:hypothetical protein
MTIEKAIEKQELVVHICLADLRSVVNDPRVPTAIVSVRAQDVVRAHDRLQFLLLMKGQQ